MYFDNTCTINTITGTPNAIGAVTETATALYTAVPCYLSEEAGTRNRNGNEAVQYTHLLYTPYKAAVDASMTVVIDSITYEITGVWPAPRNHHLELGLTRRSV